MSGPCGCQKPCGCCEPVASLTPLLVENRPALSAIGYRIGTCASFRTSMLEEIVRTPELAPLTTRLDDDYSVTMIDLWSAVADVLTFYQERYANEAFLRTATRRESVSRLARLIDYRLRPGIAALAWLAFTAEDDKSFRIDPRPARAERAGTGRAAADLRGPRDRGGRLAPEQPADSARAVRAQPTGAGRVSALVAPGEAGLPPQPVRSRRTIASPSSRRARRGRSRS